jgi:chorismate synthase
MTQIGTIAIPFESMDHVPNNPFFAANASDIPRLEAYMDELRKAGDSCGARIDVSRATCRSASASRCSTSSTPTSRTR